MTTLIPKYDQGSTGAVNRTISQKLSDTVSVFDFGAIGNGTTDDTAAFNAAWTATNPKAVLAPAGSYKITGCLVSQIPIQGNVCINHLFRSCTF